MFGSDTYVCTEDCFFAAFQCGPAGQSGSLKLNNINVAVGDSDNGSNNESHAAFGFAKKGDTIVRSGMSIKVFGLR